MLDNGSGVGDYESNAREQAAADDSHEHRRRVMSEDVTDHGLLDLSGLSMDAPLDKSALARALARVLAASENGPSNSFSASI